jgi:hypothetical protein
MDEVIEIMARADVDYFWRDPGKRFENFTKPIADGVRSRMEAIRNALKSLGFTINRAPAVGSDIYEARLVEIGRITTTWAKFEHWIDQAIWVLAKVNPREGACITTQIASVPAKFRALQSLMAEAGRPEDAQKAVARLSSKAQEVALIRNRFAHGPLDIGINLETREFEVYLRQVSVDRKTLTFQTTPLTHEELKAAQKQVSELYVELIKIFSSIVDGHSIDSLAPPHEQ